MVKAFNSIALDHNSQEGHQRGSIKSRFNLSVHLEKD
jgi:hypothetical protein